MSHFARQIRISNQGTTHPDKICLTFLQHLFSYYGVT